MEPTDEIAEYFAARKLEDAYKEFERRHGYDPRPDASLIFGSYDVVSGGMSHVVDRDGNRVNFHNLLVFNYIEQTNHDQPYSVGLVFTESQFSSELREMQINEILDGEV